MEITTVNIKFLFTIILLATISCKPQENLKADQFLLEINKAAFDKKLLDLVFYAKDKFEQQFKTSPIVIVVTASKNNGKLEFFIENLASLYYDNDERLLIDYKFTGISFIGKTPILLKNNKSITLPLINILEHKERIFVNYSNNVNSYNTKYEFSNNNFLFIRGYFSFDLITN